ncbi:MerR family transcriptional regulator [Streptomyces sp. AM 3-1-1]|uniref:MerR family transcriptional regulator n=1 Tax=Streptomyces sp. AM 3-1-1 TaxID=3028711 RepID=UPI0023B9F359|nr:MerR family transcriptional regulator [Streptomyces sp. AM 3-1-1]WEH30750.1 MerR family DNA-binding transcriptional regulator [Streptomyces sp. AM 3-1-1]
MLIGELARRSGVSARMLRHYEALGLVRPRGRTGSGYREYGADDVRRVFHVESLRSLGLSLREVGRALDDPDFAPARLVEELARRTRERIAAETELLTRLDRVRAAGPADWDDVLRGAALLRALGAWNADDRQRAALAAEGGPVPAEALADAVLREPDPYVAGALRWALARTDGSALAPLARGLDSPAAEVRERAARSLAALPADADADADTGVTALLRRALGHADAEVRDHAALALGARGHTEAVPALVAMVVAGRHDVDAADALSRLAGEGGGVGDRVVGLLAEGLEPGGAGAAARRRIAQALADIPGDAATRLLLALTRDEDRGVAVSAAYGAGRRGE